MKYQPTLPTNAHTTSETPPRLSIIIPAYNSHATIAGTLRALRAQSYRDFECIVVDSGPSDEAQNIVARDFPEVRFFRSTRQLPPHAARDYGTYYARGNLFVFTDPDIYPAVDWLALMVAAYDAQPGVIVGAIDCFDNNWLDVGIHLCKFHKCLPGPTQIDVSPTGNMLCDRNLFFHMGGFASNDTQGDVVMSWRIMDAGHALCFVPTSVVYHHHTMTWAGYVQERYARGRGYAALVSARERWQRRELLWRALITLLPLRLTNLLITGAKHTWQAGRIGDYLRTLPVYLVGQAVWLAGEASYMLEVLRKK